MLRTIAAAAILTFTATGAIAADVGPLGQENSDQWRASKLAGVPIYGPENQNDGTIKDVLMSKDGKAEYVIIGVGGFLGIDQKDVAIPYDQVKFTDQPITPPPANPPGFNNAMGGTAADGGIPPGTAQGAITATNGVAPAPGTVGLGTPVDNTGNGMAPSAAGTAGRAMAQSTAYPDHGTIDMTVDQLKAAPTFKFAS